MAVVAVALPALSYGSLVLWSVLNKYPIKLLYTWHPVLGVAFFVLAAIGAATAQSARAPGRHKAAITLHGYINVAATLCALGCAAVIYLNKEMHGKQHLKSWHGRLGAATVLLCVIQQAAGAAIWYFPKAIGAQGAKLRQMYQSHAIGGYAALLAIAGTHFMAVKGGYAGYMDSPLWWAVAAFLAVTVMTLLTGANLPKAKPKAQ